MERVLLQGGAMGLFLLLGALRPRVSDQKLLNADLIINLLTGLLLFLTLAPVMRYASEAAVVGLIDMSWLTAPWAQFALAFLLLDLTRYWVHRLDHRIPWLWTFHRVHHSSEHMDATSGLRMHAVDFVQLSLIPIVLFGVLLDTSSFAGWTITAAFGVSIFFDAFQHANLNIDLQHPLWRAWHMLLNNPHFHAWHHTRDGALCDGNYANTLIIWDRLFGSEVTKPALPEAFGLEGDQALAGTQESTLAPGRLGGAVLKLQLLRGRAAT